MNQLQQFLEDCGVQDATAIDVNNRELMEKIGLDINRQLAVGANALRTLKNERCKFDKDMEKMGITQEGLEMETDCVEDFIERTPSFLLASANFSGKLLTSAGSGCRLEIGQEVCVGMKVYCETNRERQMLKPSERKFSDVYRPYRGEDLNGKRLLIWRTGGIGDILFIRPIMRYLKQKYDCTIHFSTATAPKLVESWIEEGTIDEFTPMPFLASALDDADYHITFESLIERCKDAERIDVHELFARHCRVDCSEIEWNVPMKVKSANGWFQKAPQKYVVVQPHASSVMRTPRNGTMVQAINAATKAGYAAVLVDYPQRAPAMRHIISCCERPDMCINFCEHSMGLEDAIVLVDGAALVIAPDSSMTHIAAAQGVPSVALYGPFPADVRTQFYPLCRALEPPPSTVCEFGGKACFKHSHTRCNNREACWEFFNNKKMTTIIEDLLCT